MALDLQDPKTRAAAVVAAVVVVVVIIIIFLVVGGGPSPPFDCASGGADACPQGQACLTNGQCGCTFAWPGGCSQGSGGFQRYAGAWPSDRYFSSAGGAVNPATLAANQTLYECEQLCAADPGGCSGYSYDANTQACALWPPPFPPALKAEGNADGADISMMTYGLRPETTLALPDSCPIAGYNPQEADLGGLAPGSLPPGCWDSNLGDLKSYTMYTGMLPVGGYGVGKKPSLADCADHCAHSGTCVAWSMSQGDKYSGGIENNNDCHTYTAPLSYEQNPNSGDYTGILIA